MAFVEKNLDPSAMVDKDIYYPPIGTGIVFFVKKEKDFIRHFNNRTFTQFENQASAILTVGYYNPKNSKFQHIPVKEDVILVGGTHKDVNRLRNGYITEVFKNVAFDEIVKLCGKNVMFMTELFTKKTVVFQPLKTS